MPSPASTARLVIDSVVVEYPNGESSLRALDDVSLSIDAGTVAMVIGPSGSGKSTLLEVCAALTAPTSGTAVIHTADGDTVDLTTTDAAVRREHLGIVFQSPYLIDSLTIREQLVVTGALGGRLSRRRRRELEQRADDLLAQVGLEGLGRRRVSALSGGQRQRVTIARALMGNPSVMLVDEPTASLDSRSGRAIMDLLVGLRERSVATVIVTHDTEYLPLADAVYTMRDGRLSRGGQDDVSRRSCSLR